ncbi:nitrate reductase [Nitrincola schmidtii]|uniref:nitrate reductase n=1 Tax=Nitrincola schmidtii TaxID=1730894 RepID=UPI00124D7A83|nr:nitrate reductase [Nitrincola schmidtii]
MKHRTTCPYCGVGCGVTAELNNHYLLNVAGDLEHPANYGRLCIKGSTLHKTTTTNSRLLMPSIEGRATDWDTALNTVATQIRKTVDQYGPNSVAMYLSGQLLTEDYYVANKLMKGFIGSAQVDTNSRLCMASTVAGHKRAFGADAVPGCYEDLENADLILLVGSNAAWNHPILYQRIQAAKQTNPALRVVVIDPRKTASCDIADLHLPLRPGSDAALFNALLVFLADQGHLNEEFIAEHTEGFAEALSSAKTDIPNLAIAAEKTDLKQHDLSEFFQWFAITPRTVSLFSQGVNQSSSGTDKVNSLINCHLATGRIGKPGSTPFSLTGQPNAMGGREVGGLANQLAAHMDFNEDNVDRVKRFWNATNMAKEPGLKALDMFKAIDQGEIKIIWIMATNPLVSLPDTHLIRRALKRCDLVIVSESMAETDTLKLADICLPASSWSEKNGTVTNSERCISRQRGLLPPPGEARHDWQIICDVAKRLGFADAFDYQDPADIFAEHAALSGYENTGSRCFDISELSKLSKVEYDHLEPIQWPVNTATPYGTQRLFCDGQFYTPSGKARLIPICSQDPIQCLTQDQPLRLNTGRIRDQWHTMTRTGRAASLFRHRYEPFIELHPENARMHNLEDMDLATLTNSQGHFTGRVRVTKAQRFGEAFVPMHWTESFSSEGRCNSLIQSVADPISGQPESKQGAVKLSKYKTAWQARLLTTKALPVNLRGYWARVPQENSMGYVLADTLLPTNWNDWCLKHLGKKADMQLESNPTGTLHAYALENGRLLWLLLVSPFNIFPEFKDLDRQFARSTLTDSQKLNLLKSDPSTTPAELICSCFQVDDYSIRKSIQTGCDSIEMLGKTLQCGTNCGSCIPELKALLAQEAEDVTQ